MSAVRWLEALFAGYYVPSGHGQLMWKEVLNRVRDRDRRARMSRRVPENSSLQIRVVNGFD